MNRKEQIAEILRDNITWSPQTQGLVIHGAVEKLDTRERLSFNKGLIGGWIGGMIVALVIITITWLRMANSPVFPVLTPEQQMEDSLPGLPRLTGPAQIQKEG